MLLDKKICYINLISLYVCNCFVLRCMYLGLLINQYTILYMVTNLYITTVATSIHIRKLTIYSWGSFQMIPLDLQHQ